MIENIPILILRVIYFSLTCPVWQCIVLCIVYGVAWYCNVLGMVLCMVLYSAGYGAVYGVV